MKDRAQAAGRTGPYRWRPAVAPFRPPRAARARPRKSAPGQMLLPGIESPAPPSPASGTVCPNCGGTEFDDDGDCVRCWEPGVATARPPEQSDTP